MPRANILTMWNGDGREALPDFTALVINNIIAVVHRASQGLLLQDAVYSQRRTAALSAGLLFGAYHVIDNSDPILQAQNFIRAAQPTQQTLMACVYRDTYNSTALYDVMRFISFVDQNAGPGIQCVLLSGDMIRQTLRPHAGGFQAANMKGAETFFAQHRLWLDEFGPSENIPWPWSDAGLAQQWAGAYAWKCQPSQPPNAITGNAGLNWYDGDLTKLAKNWASLNSGSV